jgi:predicted lipoprotein with Yx(FWY)xxD motif
LVQPEDGLTLVNQETTIPVSRIATSTLEVTMSNPFSTTGASNGAHRTRRLLAPLGIASIALVAAACGSTTASSAALSKPAVAQVAQPAGAVLATAKTALGTILVDAHGRTVYEFASDSKNTSTCSGQCLTYWPIVPAPATLPTALPGITGTVGSFARPDGGNQLTINGLPLYTYAADSGPGATTGQGSTGSGAKWWVVAPAGTPVTTAAPSGQPATNGY